MTLPIKTCPICSSPAEIHTNGVVKCPACGWTRQPDSAATLRANIVELSREKRRWSKRVKRLEARTRLAQEILDGKRDDLLPLEPVIS